MIITEVKGDLFTVPKDYSLVHCISADFALGAGIAKEFAKRGVKDYLLHMYNYNTAQVGTCIVTFATGWEAEFNLVTKEKYWEKPSYEDLKRSLIYLTEMSSFSGRNKLAMPRIGCGLDKLEWCKVKSILEEVFANTNTEILVCSI